MKIFVALRAGRVFTRNMNNTNELKKNIETLAKQEEKTPLEIISQLQHGATIAGNEELLDALCEVKWDYISL